MLFGGVRGDRPKKEISSFAGGASRPVVAFSRDWAFRIRLARHIPSMGGGVGKGIRLCTFIFVRSTGVLFPVPPHSLKEAGSKDYFEQTFAPRDCTVHQQGTYHRLVRNDSGVHVEEARWVEVYTQEELAKMETAQHQKCAKKTQIPSWIF